MPKFQENNSTFVDSTENMFSLHFQYLIQYTSAHLMSEHLVYIKM